jgi:YVTN family beta-propeller protein
MLPPPFHNAHENWEQTIIPVSKGSEGFDVSPDSSELWTVSAEDGKIFIIDLLEKKTSAKIDGKIFGANRLKFTPDGKMVFISSLRTGDVTIYDSKTRMEIKRLNIGHGAAGILMDNDSSRAFVASSGDNYLAVIDLKSLTVTAKIDVGGMPDGLAWAIQH